MLENISLRRPKSEKEEVAVSSIAISEDERKRDQRLTLTIVVRIFELIMISYKIPGEI
jgi:hypothetical protein